MSYEKNTWQTGDVVTASKLNNMENGIAANDEARGVVTVGSIDLTAMAVSLNKTAGELWTAFKAGIPIIATIDDVPPFSVDMAFCLIYVSDKGEQGYHFAFYDGQDLWIFNAADAQAYPSHSLS